MKLDCKTGTHIGAHRQLAALLSAMPLPPGSACSPTEVCSSHGASSEHEQFLRLVAARSQLRLARAGIPLARQQRGREEEEAGIAQLLLRYGVAADQATADRQAATKSLSIMTAARVEHNLEALHFLGWNTQQVSPATILHAGPNLVSRTAFCRAHGYALLTTAVCCTHLCGFVAPLLGLLFGGSQRPATRIFFNQMAPG